MENIPYDLAITILDEMDCVALIDAKGSYIYQNRGWYERRSESGQNALAAYPWEILKDSKAQEVIRTHQKITGHIMKSGKETICVNYYPVFKNDTFFGVLIWTFFTGTKIVQAFLEQINQLNKELEHIKAINRDLSRASYSISNIIGESKAIAALKSEIVDIAKTSSNVLIEGETGVGKELVAHAIHDLSKRNQERFVRVNCAAIPNELMESEFFGYAPGSFTGASRKGKVGKFELASKGSLFLDEVNLLPSFIQPKLLRVLQERELDRIGDDKTIQIDTRIIAATNRSLYDLVRSGEFRQDLYYRLNVVSLRIPPLRERKEDIPLLVRNLLSRLNYTLGTDIISVADDVMDLFLEYDWPGNIRELQNVLEHGMNYAHEDTILMSHIENYFRNARSLDVACSQKPQTQSPQPQPSLSPLSDAERKTILAALEACGGDKSKAAKQLGISRSTFYRKLNKYEI